jgi:hypothetical protein
MTEVSMLESPGPADDRVGAACGSRRNSATG